MSHSECSFLVFFLLILPGPELTARDCKAGHLVGGNVCVFSYRSPDESDLHLWLRTSDWIIEPGCVLTLGVTLLCFFFVLHWVFPLCVCGGVVLGRE